MQSESSVNKNQSVSNTIKHIFLREYPYGEPKRLLDGVSATEETYEQKKKILQARTGDKNQIIQAHLDYSEDIQPAPSHSPDALSLLKPTGQVTHQQFNIQQLYVLPTLYLCVLYLSEDKQRLVPLTS